MTPTRKLLTLCIIHREGRVLLGMKKRGFGAGRYNGFGGKVAPDEAVTAAAVREVREEACITPRDLTQLGVLEFAFTQTPDEILEVHVFKCTDFDGEVGESEEMKPEWFPVEAIPFETMWKDDIFWFPHFLQDRLFRGSFLFDAHDEILESKLEEVTKLP